MGSWFPSPLTPERDHWLTTRLYSRHMSLVLDLHCRALLPHFLSYGFKIIYVPVAHCEGGLYFFNIPNSQKFENLIHPSLGCWGFRISNRWGRHGHTAGRGLLTLPPWDKMASWHQVKWHSCRCGTKKAGKSFPNPLNQSVQWRSVGSKGVLNVISQLTRGREGFPLFSCSQSELTSWNTLNWWWIFGFHSHCTN